MADEECLPLLQHLDRGTEFALRRVDDQRPEGLVAVLQRAGLAYTLSDAPWPALTAEEQALWRPEFAPDDHWTVDDL